MKLTILKNLRRVALAVMCLAISVAAMAQSLNVPTIIGDKMVLQRNSTAHLWGSAEPSAEVKITTSWNKKPIVVQADMLGRWLADVPTGEAAEKQTIVIRSEGEKLSFSDIMIGEVWLCSGQSNMRFTVGNTIDVVAALKKPNPKVRLYNAGQSSSLVPMDDIYDVAWTTSSASNLRDFSAVGYVFGDILQRELNVPVGLINASYGGTLIESWMPEEEILANQEFLTGLNEAKVKNAQKWKNRPRHNAAAQYNALVHPYINATIAGVIWYQGCHNVNTTLDHYDRLLNRLIGSWREVFRNPDMPFYVVQIAPHTWEGIAGALLREKQAKVANKLEGVELVPTIDQNERTGDIHPRNKQVVGERLAAVALGAHYGKEVDFRAPQMESIKREDGKIRVKFSNAEKGLMCSDERVLGFHVSDSKGYYHLAEAVIEGSEVVVWSEEVASPTNVRYCFDEFEGNLYCTNGLPVVPFRTDFDDGRLGARSFYDTLSEMTVTVKYRDCFVKRMGDGAYPWSNKNWVLHNTMKELEGWEYLQPRALEKGEFTPKMTITAHSDGYIYVLARDIVAMSTREGWEVIPCTGMPVKDLDKKGRSRGSLYLCRHAVVAGESVTIPATEEMFGLHPIAKDIIYE